MLRKLNLLFYNIHMQHDNQKTVAEEDDILDSNRLIKGFNKLLIKIFAL